MLQNSFRAIMWQSIPFATESQILNIQYILMLFNPYATYFDDTRLQT